MAKTTEADVTKPGKTRLRPEIHRTRRKGIASWNLMSARPRVTPAPVSLPVSSCQKQTANRKASSTASWPMSRSINAGNVPKTRIPVVQSGKLSFQNLPRTTMNGMVARSASLRVVQRSSAVT